MDDYTTFGELEISQKFITMPIPGDNNGHGGFKGIHYIFEKVTKLVKDNNYSTPHGRAVNRKTGAVSDLPHSLPIIIVE